MDRDAIASWMVVIIVARELAITGLRLLAASKKLILAAEGYGKHKTITQIIAIIAMLIRASYPDWGAWASHFFTPWFFWVVITSQYLAVALTMISGAFYLWRNRNIYLSDL